MLALYSNHCSGSFILKSIVTNGEIKVSLKVGEEILIVGEALIGSAGIPHIDQIDCALVMSKFDILIKSNNISANVSANPIFLLILLSIKLTMLEADKRLFVKVP